MATGSLKLAWMKFFPGDWIQDTQVLTLEAQGAWMKLICAIWISPERGVIRWTDAQFTNFLGIKEEDAARLLEEIKAVADVTVERDKSVTGHADVTLGHWNVTVKSRRITRERDAYNLKRKQARERKRRQRDRLRHADVTPESRDRLQTPDSTPKNKRGEESQPSPEGRRSAQVLSDKIFENHPTRTAPTEAVLMEWSREADRIYKIDSHGWEEILSLLEWSQVDPFWKTNILSMSKFRKQWNQLTAHRNRGGEHGTKGTKGLDSLKDWSRRLPKP